MNGLLQDFAAKWKKQFPQWVPDNCVLLAAVSGGVDSMVLLHLLHQLQFRVEVAHVNFGLRGVASDADEALVRSTAEALGYAFHRQQFDTAGYAADHKIAIQEAARVLRYDWFRSLQQAATDPLPRLLVTAHHADDNVETVLMNLFRGTGLQGLTGMDAYRSAEHHIRPLLPFSKKILQAFADTHQIPFREDASNATDDYTRNYFRNTLLPMVQEVYPNASSNVLHTMYRLRESEQLYREAVQKHISGLLEQHEAEWRIPVLKWKKARPLVTLSYELLHPFGFSPGQVFEAIKLLDGDTGSYIQSDSHRLVKNRNWMLICPLQSQAGKQHILIPSADSEHVFVSGKLLVSPLQEPGTITDALDEVWVDADHISFPLLLRPYATGDYFYPLGLNKKKKLSRFLIDLKLSRPQKEQVWVLTTADHKIIWVLGQRIDHRFRIRPGTQTALRLHYRK